VVFTKKCIYLGWFLHHTQYELLYILHFSCFCINYVMWNIQKEKTCQHKKHTIPYRVHKHVLHLTSTHQESHLCSERQLVAFKQTPCCVVEDKECDGVNENKHSLFDVLHWFSAVNGITEDNTERLQWPKASLYGWLGYFIIRFFTLQLSTKPQYI